MLQDCRVDLDTGLRVLGTALGDMDNADVRRWMIIVGTGYAKNGKVCDVPMKQLLTNITKSVRLANN